MIGRAIQIIFALTRLDTCILVFVSVLLPTYYYTHDFGFSLSHSAPLLTICMCGFVINDLSDIEKDRENHPDRPLPSNSIGEIAASFVYFSLLTTSLALIRIYIDVPYVYLYALLLVALINYNYIVAYVPKSKNFYVAFVGLIPILILSSLIQNEKAAALILPSLFLFLLGREMLVDVNDLKGDKQTLAKSIGATVAENLAFAIKALGSLGLVFSATNAIDFAVITALTFLDVIFIFLWKKNRQRRVIIHAMKLQLLFGIYFLMARTDAVVI